MGGIIHVNYARSIQLYNNHGAHVLSCLASPVKVKFLAGPPVNTENKFAYANISNLVSKAATASSDAASSTRAEPSLSPIAVAFSASAGVANWVM